jgi:hypothetical protein
MRLIALVMALVRFIIPVLTPLLMVVINLNALSLMREVTLVLV